MAQFTGRGAAKFRAAGVQQRALLARLRNFVRCNEGTFAVTFGVALVPIVLTVGAAVDYSVANRAKARLDAALDAAALAAVSKGAITKTKNEAKTLALNAFAADSTGLSEVTVHNTTADVTDASSGRSVTVSYSASVPTSFMGLAGIKTLAIKGQAKANSGLLTYIDFYLLLDNTPSRAWARPRPTSTPWWRTRRTSARSRATTCPTRTTTTISPRSSA